jgi:hypothetical protein
MATPDPLFVKWSDWLEQIHEEQLRDLLINRHIFHQFRDSVNPHGDRLQAPELAEWMHQGYVAYAIAAVRKMAQQPKKGFNSLSLGILLDDLKANQPRLTRATFGQMYDPNSPARRLADRDFDQVSGTSGCNAFPLAVIDRDIQDLKAVARPVKELADKVMFHTDMDRSNITIPTYGQFDQAIDFLRDTFAKYHLLITARAYVPVPLDDFDVRGALARLWQQ